ncbi:MAG: serine/threonine protein phosphatase [Oscillospiraceae bacterium]
MFAPTRTNFSDSAFPIGGFESYVFQQIREKIPIIDACIQKIIRLVGEFEIVCDDEECQREIDSFLKDVRVGGSVTGIKQFICCYLEQLLVYGNAIGEIVPNKDFDGVGYLYNAHAENVFVKEGATPFDLEFFVKQGIETIKIPNNDYILFTPLNPKSGEITGNSILEGLDFIGEILLKIYSAIGKSFERIGDLRYAVTYNPKGEISPTTAKEIAEDLSTRWSEVMSRKGGSQISDFMAVGDVSVKVIGAENDIFEVKEPIRCLLEQIIAKLGIPPFMLGISWSSTERMSKQQSDILTSEIKNYRQLLSPVAEKICRLHLAMKGMFCGIDVRWQSISLDDEVEIAEARLISARAMEIEEKGE